MDYKTIFTFNNIENIQTILGPLNRNVVILEEKLNIPITITTDTVLVPAECDSSKLETFFNIVSELLKNGIFIKERDVVCILAMLEEYPETEIVDFYAHKVVVLNTFDSKTITTKSINQNRYLAMLKAHDIIFATGSAGTGKTYLAVAYAVAELKKNTVKKIIITRPAVEAGEKLGFLPGDLKEKVDPYLIPIYDAIYEFLGKPSADKLIERGVIEVAPLAYMRGRTLDNAFIILDEAQNTTRNQMKMFLTRLGFHSKMVVTGDTTQIDLVNKQSSGLVEAINILKSVKNIAMIKFTRSDVMRHPLVAKIIEKYEEIEHD